MECEDRRLSLYDILEKHTIKELKEVFSFAGWKFKSGVKKAVMVQALGRWLIENTEQFIDGLLTYELRMYNELVNHTEKPFVMPEGFRQYPITDFLMTRQCEFCSYIAPELKEPFSRLLPAEIERREKSGEAEVEDHIIGSVNLCGPMPLHLVMPGILADDITDELLKTIYRLHRFISADADDDSIVMVESPYGIEGEFNPFDPRCVDQNVDYKKFTDVEIRKAAEMPFPRIGGASRDRLLAALVKGGIPQWDVERVVLKLWFDKQVEPDAIMPNLDFLQYVRDKRVDEILSLIQTYLNKMPYWRFKGWSSKEIASRQRTRKASGMPVIMPGPGLQAMGIDTPEQMMAMLGGEEDFPQFGGFPFAPGRRQIGRNDPCPCGCGKKYKNCCGKNSN